MIGSKSQIHHVNVRPLKTITESGGGGGIANSQTGVEMLLSDMHT